MKEGGGIPSNIGTIKVHFEEKTMALSKGVNTFKLDSAFKPSKVFSITILYGNYIGGQPMMAGDGNYAADYGLAPTIQWHTDGTASINIVASGSYSERPLRVCLFYI